MHYGERGLTLGKLFFFFFSFFLFFFVISSIRSSQCSYEFLTELKCYPNIFLKNFGSTLGEHSWGALLEGTLEGTLSLRGTLKGHSLKAFFSETLFEINLWLLLIPLFENFSRYSLRHSSLDTLLKVLF